MEIKERKRADYCPLAHVMPLGWRNWGEGSEKKERVFNLGQNWTT